jgi:hypothetical protein
MSAPTRTTATTGTVSASASATAAAVGLRWLLTIVAAVAIVWMLVDVFRTLERANAIAVSPASASASAHQAKLDHGASAWQTMYLPVCAPATLEIALAAPIDAPGTLATAWFVLEDASRWPATPASEHAVLVTPGQTSVSVPVPATAVAGQLAGLRLTADRVSVVLPTTRENIVPTGYFTKRAGFFSTEDLVFNTAAERQGWLATLSCITRTQPASQQGPQLLAVALTIAAIGGIWLATLSTRV